MDTIYQTINIFDSLKLKYREYLKHEIISISIIQSEEGVWLESVESVIVQRGFEKHTIRRINLDFIAEGDELEDAFFNTKDPIEVKAIKFIDEFSPYSIINTTDLFNSEASKKINKKYNTFGVDK